MAHIGTTCAKPSSNRLANHKPSVMMDGTTAKLGESSLEKAMLDLPVGPADNLASVMTRR